MNRIFCQFLCSFSSFRLCCFSGMHFSCVCHKFFIFFFFSILKHFRRANNTIRRRLKYEETVCCCFSPYSVISKVQKVQKLSHYFLLCNLQLKNNSKAYKSNFPTTNFCRRRRRYWFFFSFFRECNVDWHNFCIQRCMMIHSSVENIAMNRLLVDEGWKGTFFFHLKWIHQAYN